MTTDKHGTYNADVICNVQHYTTHNKVVLYLLHGAL